jgi:hypothetical protein
LCNLFFIPKEALKMNKNHKVYDLSKRRDENEEKLEAPNGSVVV